GGNGGYSRGGVGGTAGYGKSYLTFNDPMVNATPASSLTGYSRATGGNASGSTIPGTGGAANSPINLTGSHDVRAQSFANGANGGAGASSTLNNAVSGTTTGGTLQLYQTARGGAGGYSNGGTVGQAGYAASGLSFNDATATSLQGSSKAYGGAGGNGRGTS